MTTGVNDSLSPALQPQTSAGVRYQDKDSTNVDGERHPNIVVEFSDTEATDLIGKGPSDEEQPQKSAVPDGGYGWFVVLGCFLSHVIIGALERSDGIFFLQFQEKYGFSAQITAWPGALVSALRLMFGPVASLVCNRFSVRSACIVGSILTFLGLFLDGFSPNFYFLFLSHFFIQGVGRGLVYGPGLFLVGMYFDKRRGIASGLSTSGVGVGTFLLVPLSQFLFENYGYRGAFMLIAAITLNLCVCAMLYRPLSLHFKFTKGKEVKGADEISLQEGLVLANAVEPLDATSIRSWKAHYNSKLSIDVDKVDTEDECYINELKNASGRNQEGCLKSSLKVCFPIENYNKNKGAKRKLFHFYLLKNPSFLLCCCSILLFTSAFKSAFTFIPAQVKSLGNTESEAAMVLSITGVLDTIGRILIGFFFDIKFVKKYRFIIYTTFIFSVASVSFILPRLEDYASVCVICAIYGFLSGGFISQKSVIMVDILGAENIANSFGLLICFQGIGMIIGPPASGALKDATGTFLLAFDFGGSLMLCAGFLMILSNICFYRLSRKKRECGQVNGG